MRTLPATMIRALAPFVPLFSKSVWQHVRVLVAGAILAPGRRTVSSALRATGLEQEKRFHCFHRVLSRASWSSREVSGVLLRLLVGTFVPEEDPLDRKSTRLNSSHANISYAVFCLKKKKILTIK